MQTAIARTSSPLAILADALLAPANGDRPDGWRPLMDARQYGDRLELDIELPGIDRDQVEITLDRDVLVVTGTRAPDGSQDGSRDDGRDGAEPTADAPSWTRQERPDGRFTRRVRLPGHVARDAVTATMSDGILHVRVDLAAATDARRIDIG